MNPRTDDYLNLPNLLRLERMEIEDRRKVALWREEAEGQTIGPTALRAICEFCDLRELERATMSEDRFCLFSDTAPNSGTCEHWQPRYRVTAEPEDNPPGS